MRINLQLDVMDSENLTEVEGATPDAEIIDGHITISLEGQGIKSALLGDFDSLILNVSSKDIPKYSILATKLREALEHNLESQSGKLVAQFELHAVGDDAVRLEIKLKDEVVVDGENEDREFALAGFEETATHTVAAVLANSDGFQVYEKGATGGEFSLNEQWVGVHKDIESQKGFTTFNRFNPNSIEDAGDRKIATGITDGLEFIANQHKSATIVTNVEISENTDGGTNYNIEKISAGACGSLGKTCGGCNTYLVLPPETQTAMMDKGAFNYNQSNVGVNGSYGIKGRAPTP